MITLPLEFFRGVVPLIALKSPVRMARVGTVIKLFEVVAWRYCSKLKKKKALSRPLKILGRYTGPPSVKPKSFLLLRGRSLPPVPSDVNGVPAFRASFTK